MVTAEHLQHQAGAAASLERAVRTLHAEGKLPNPGYTQALVLVSQCRGLATVTIWQHLSENAPELLAVLWEKAGLKRPEVV